MSDGTTTTSARGVDRVERRPGRTAGRRRPGARRPTRPDVRRYGPAVRGRRAASRAPAAIRRAASSSTWPPFSGLRPPVYRNRTGPARRRRRSTPPGPAPQPRRAGRSRPPPGGPGRRRWRPAPGPRWPTGPGPGRRRPASSAGRRLRASSQSPVDLARRSTRRRPPGSTAAGRGRRGTGGRSTTRSRAW